ncbi:hypothetical protein JCM19046_2476 [Bacillus sp. JCM 19046]|uniref:Undecaprenyl pyrophosphate phosphatase UppP n=1 Tax=Shouchella xiaoxiensis TaxID=766895 RepID=A0ABS2SRZ0_9BACI|nr:DUF2663 family protein [Shouchella xiaoxiensis]MBM7838274.1 undecaprenyl pyrophosphate phosphatase UppP [Shouchella xiaoxiensis]GAF12148.1 hypothetical protein JCM19045_1306 [Bacillus sp. JCM 19045]GAF17939.1 hypothetical protein JCM19046_2476 [Bacillus sp. JCM 19046]
MNGIYSMKAISIELVKRKETWDKLEKEKAFYLWVSLTVSFLLIGLISIGATVRSLPHEELFASPIRVGCILVLTAAITRMIHLTKKAEKKEKEFEELRLEFIDRSDEFFSNVLSQNEKEAYLKEMNDQHNINLSYYH